MPIGLMTGTHLPGYLSENPRELLIGAGPGNFHSYFGRGITWNFFGHNSYLHWTGELGIGGFSARGVVPFGLSVHERRRGNQNPLGGLAARTCLALVITAEWLQPGVPKACLELKGWVITACFS